MRTYTLKLLQKRKAIYFLYSLMTIMMLFSMLTGRTSFDVFEFLPSSASSIQGSNILRQSGRSVSSLWLMMPREDLDKVEEIKTRIEKLPEIKQVLWISNWGNAYQASFMHQKALSTAYFSKDQTLMEIQFSPNVSREEQYQSIEVIHSIIPPEAVLGGEALILAELKKLMSFQPRYYLLIAILSIFLILLFYFRSWKKPIVILLGMGVSIIWALGLASLWQSMSTITRAVTPAILLGITLDYSLFFIHRLEESKNSPLPFEEIIVTALQKTFKPVLISALTTLTGLATLLLMKFGMGPDLGLALIRGVLISLLLNMTLLPCLVYSTQDLWEAKKFLQHKTNPKRLIVQFRLLIKILFPVVLILSICFAFLGTQANYYISNRKQFKENTTIMKSTHEIEAVFGSKEMAFILYPPISDNEEIAWNKQISSLPSVEKILSFNTSVNPDLPHFLLPEVVLDQFIVPPYRRAVLFFKNSIDNPSTSEDLKKIIHFNDAVFSESYIAGPLGLEHEVKAMLKQDLNRVTLWSALLIALIILISFRSFWLTVVVVGGVQLSIWSNIGISHFSGLSLYQLTPIFISAIQMGATIDYGVYFVSRFMEEKSQGKDFWNTMYSTWIHSFSAVFTSAIILFSATIGISFISSLSTASQIAMLLGRGALLSFTLVMFFLPLWLYPVFKKAKEPKYDQ